MKEIEIIRDRLNNFMSGCEDSTGSRPPDDYTYQHISKIECTRYATQEVESIKFFFRTKGKKGNNKPYTYQEEVPVGTYNMICDWLIKARTHKHHTGEMESLFDKPLALKNIKTSQDIDPDFINDREY